MGSNPVYLVQIVRLVEDSSSPRGHAPYTSKVYSSADIKGTRKFITNVQSSGIRINLIPPIPPP
jgi:hypothetical protein